jgi:3-oxoacyl-[acyl-carrier-protein] synthase II
LLALESEDHLARRGGRALAELVGYGSNCGAEHLTAPDRDSEVEAMRLALSDAGSAHDAIDLVLAHGTATRRNDLVEGQAIREVFGDNGRRPAVAALKSMTGTRWAPRGRSAPQRGLRARLGHRPATINLDAPDPSCDIAGFEPVATPRPLGLAMVNAFAFGGHNAVLILRRA